MPGPALAPLPDPTEFLRSGTWNRPALTAILRAGADAHAASRKGREAITLLERPDSVAIVTGQQPAIGGGPLYSLVKTAYAIALARTLGTAAAPVFWCASEDHDVGEAGHADLITRDGTLRRFSAPLGAGRASLRFRPAATWWEPLIAHCRQHLGPGAGDAWLEEHRPLADEGMGAWTCRVFSALFERHGLVCCEAHHLRPLWRATVGRALDGWPATALADLRQRLLAEGAADPFGPLAQPPLFVDRADGRGATSVDQARALLASDAEVLSPGAALRPVLQQAALPALAYVGGPGELAYHRFIMPLYAALGVPAPALVPRCSLTLVPSWVRRGCERWQVTPDAFTGPAPVPMDAGRDVLAQLDAALSALEHQPLPPTHRQRVQTGLVRVRRERDRLAASLGRADRLAAQRPPWGALQGWLFPRGGRQERGMSLFQAVWECGPGIADVLVEAAAACAPGVHGWVDLR